MYIVPKKGVSKQNSINIQLTRFRHQILVLIYSSINQCFHIYSAAHRGILPLEPRLLYCLPTLASASWIPIHQILNLVTCILPPISEIGNTVYYSNCRRCTIEPERKKVDLYYHYIKGDNNMQIF